MVTGIYTLEGLVDIVSTCPDMLATKELSQNIDRRLRRLSIFCGTINNFTQHVRNAIILSSLTEVKRVRKNVINC
jgi:hypothetical protein